ncbi:MAG TPA: hypothetical protein VKE73_12835 [Myxococcota bacterium]|nr:hypothetical protein [Myxococcota bacterium]
MSASTVFERTCSELAQATSFDTLSARGTVRLALKSAGLDPGEVTSGQMLVVLQRLLPGELKARGVKEPESVCATIAARIDGLAPEAPAQSVEAVFRRLGGG